MKREDCEGCEFYGKGSILLDDNIPACKHPDILHGVGMWVARIKECPKQKEGEQE